MRFIVKLMILAGFVLGLYYAMAAVYKNNEEHIASRPPSITMTYAEGRTCIVRFEGGNINAECTLDDELWWMCAETGVDNRLERLYHCEEKIDGE